MARTPKTILSIKVGDKEFNIKYNGSFEYPETKLQMKHDERLMSMLLGDERAFNFFYRIVEPVVRFKKREAKKKNKQKA